MPLDPLPPLAPHEKKTSPPKHVCSMSTPCPICLSDVGKCYHSFPKGTFKARFSLPILPKFVLKHYAANPPVWTWSIKDRPNKGKSFQVPTIPVASSKLAPKAVQWIAAVFHLFKAHLSPIAIDTETGRIHQAWLCLYQNNMYIHLQAQLKVSHKVSTQHSSPPPPTKGNTSVPVDGPSPFSNVIAELRAKIALLHKKLYNLAVPHKACCLRHSNPPPSPPLGVIPKEGSTNPTPSPPPPPFLLLKASQNGIAPDPHLPSWLTTALSIEDIPSAFKGTLYSPSSVTLSTTLPQGTVSTIKLAFEGSTPFYLGILPRGFLEVAPMADCSLVANVYRFPPDSTIPMACWK
ncbi:hypothetical protein EDC04DRAFT_2891183 [Pisolithus marmoratus]|nr:hypothetical protein EDC04DRAFT_2891183 [Pisolithus marmoratus]